MTADPTVDVARWYAEEAMLLDERRFDEWLALLDPDVHYVVPIRRNRAPVDSTTFDDWRVASELGAADDLSLVDCDHAGLVARIDRLRTGVAWAERPPSRTTRLVSNVLTWPDPDDDDIVRARTAFILRRTRVEAEQDLISGARHDRLHRHDGSWRLLERVVVLATAVLPSHNLSVLL